MSRQDGGPAFPVLERGGQGLELSHPGISALDYAAIHLPAEPMTQELAEWVMGREGPRPKNGICPAPEDFHLFKAEAEMRWRYMRAGMLIKARGE